MQETSFTTYSHYIIRCSFDLTPLIQDMLKHIHDGNYSLFRPLSLMESIFHCSFQNAKEMEEYIYQLTHQYSFSHNLYKIFNKYSLGLGGFERDLRKVLLSYIETV